MPVPPPESGIGRGSACSSNGRLANQTGDIAGAGENVGEDGGLGAVGLAVPGGMFHATTPLVGVAAFGITQPPDAQLPGRGVDLEVTGETDVAIGQSAIDDDGAAKRCIRLLKGTIGRDEGKNILRIRWRIADENIGERMAEAALTTDPLAVAPLVIVAVEAEAIAGGTKWIASGIVAALQASEGVFVDSVMTKLDSAQSLQTVVNKEKNAVKALTGIADHLADSQMRETAK